MFVVPLYYVLNVNYTYSVWILCVTGRVTRYSPLLEFLLSKPYLERKEMVHVCVPEYKLGPRIGIVQKSLHCNAKEIKYNESDFCSKDEQS